MTVLTWNDMRRLAVDASKLELHADYILRQISEFSDGEVAKAVQAERERIAQAIEANVHNPCEEGCSHDHAIALAARIARAEQ